jgi:hypothetical protein
MTQPLALRPTFGHSAINALSAVGPGSANDPDERGRSTNSLKTLGQLTLPARSNHDKIAGGRAGRALSHPSERISPHVEHLQQVIPALRVRHRNDDRLLSQIEPAQRIECVEVGMSGTPKRGRRERARVRERVHWPATKLLACLDVAEVLARDIHNHKWIEIDVRLLRDALGLFGRQSDYGHHRLLRPCRKWPRSCATQNTEEIPALHARSLALDEAS